MFHFICNTNENINIKRDWSKQCYSYMTLNGNAMFRTDNAVLSALSSFAIISLRKRAGYCFTLIVLLLSLINTMKLLYETFVWIFLWNVCVYHTLLYRRWNFGMQLHITCWSFPVVPLCLINATFKWTANSTKLLDKKMDSTKKCIWDSPCFVRGTSKWRPKELKSFLEWICRHLKSCRNYR